MAVPPGRARIWTPRAGTGADNALPASRRQSSPTRQAVGVTVSAAGIGSRSRDGRKSVGVPATDSRR